MKTVAIFARKGGVGKSTTSFNLACHAARSGIKSMLISMDPQGDSIRWANKDRPLKMDDLFTSEHGVKTLYLPYSREREMDLGLGSMGLDLLIVDMPPVHEAIEHVKPDLWVIPVDGRNAIIDTMPCIKHMKTKCPHIAWLPNRINAGGESAASAIREALAELGDQVLPEVADSAVIARSGEASTPVWKAPFQGIGATMLVNACNSILDLCGLVKATSLPSSTTRNPSRRRR